MSEDASTLALAPFVRIFTYSVIKSIKNKNLSDRKYVLHADMVPKVTEKVMLASMGEGVISSREPSVFGMSSSSEVVTESKVVSQSLNQKQFEPKLKLTHPDQQINNEAIKINGSQIPTLNPLMPKSHISVNSNMPRQNMPPVQEMVMPLSPVNEEDELTQFYGKISPLLNDPSITVIECQGAGKPLVIVRHGQRSSAKIVLSEADIGQILQKVSDAAHIPLMDGVFRAAVDIFTINAVVSDVIGSRFVIKIQPPVQSPPQEMLSMGVSPIMSPR